MTSVEQAKKNLDIAEADRIKAEEQAIEDAKKADQIKANKLAVMKADWKVDEDDKPIVKEEKFRVIDTNNFERVEITLKQFNPNRHRHVVTGKKFAKGARLFDMHTKAKKKKEDK